MTVWRQLYSHKTADRHSWRPASEQSGAFRNGGVVRGQQSLMSSGGHKFDSKWWIIYLLYNCWMCS